MFESEVLPVTTTEGRRPTTTAGDRLIVILAALALVGGALIALGNLLPPSEAAQTSDASATPADATAPAASASVRPTPTPRPLRNFQLTAGPPPAPPEEQESFSGWVRAIEDVPIRYSPSEDASIIGTLSAGEVAYVEMPSDDEAETGWLFMSEPLSAWIPSEINGRQAIDFADARDAYAGWLNLLVAGPDGFAALGSDPVRSGFGDIVASSGDGRAWRQSDHNLFGDAWASSLAYGPAGWLLVQNTFEGDRTSAWIWRSDDLLSWEPLGSLDSASGEPGQLVASDAGYLMLVNWSNGYGSGAASVWFSTDGVVWSERIRPRSVLSGEIASLSATPLGFFAHGYDSDGSEIGYFSADGWTWSPASPVGFESLAGVVAAGDQLVAVDRDSRGESRAWLGSLVGDDLTWIHDGSSTDAFDRAVVTSLVSDGVTAMAIGWDRQTEAALYWIRTSSSWDRRAFPADYASLPRIAAAGPDGYVVSGMRAGPLGLDPVVWHFAAGSWMPQTSGPITAATAPTAEECSSLGRDLIDLMSSNLMLYVTCFSDAPLTVRGWLHPCRDCYNVIWGAEPRWLTEPTPDRILSLAPTLSENVSWLDGVLSRSLKRDPNRAWEGNLLEVTGHLDDPAASRCRPTQDATYDEWYGGRQEIVNQCRMRFVVTSVRVLPAP